MLSRRRLLQGVTAGAVVLGFDPRSRSWVTEGRANGSLVCVPRLDGTLTVDADALAECADDFGHIVSRRPLAVLRPGSVDDIVAMVRYAHRHDLAIAMRGQGHSTYGHAQVKGGIVIDSRTLGAVHRIGQDRAVVDAGATWRQLLDASLDQGLTPPVLTDYMDLSIGGTLSGAGIGGASLHYGVQSDTALELEVVTGRGDLVRCSPRSNADLFDVALSGVGQFGIIVSATVRLVPAETSAQIFYLHYDDVDAYVSDQLRLLGERRFSYLEGQVVARSAGGYGYMIEAAAYYTPPSAPDPAALLAGLRDDRSAMQTSTMSYREWSYRLDAFIEFLKVTGAWSYPHPWIDLFVPASSVAAFARDVVANLTPADLGGGAILFYPVDTRRFTRPLFRVPSEPSAFLFSLLRFAPPDDPASLAAMLAGNRDLYDRARSLGGTRYIPSSAIPDFTEHDWRRHYGPRWGLVTRSKRRFDPGHVLTPGPGIF